MDQLQALIVAGGQVGFDTQQVATVIIDALVNGQLDAQVRKVMANIPLRGPVGIAADCGDKSDQ